MPLYFDPFLKIEVPEGGAQSLAVDPTNPNVGSSGHTDGSVRFVDAGIEHYNPSSFQIISAGKDDAFDFSQSTTEPTAPAGVVNHSEFAIVKRLDSTAPTVDHVFGVEVPKLTSEPTAPEAGGGPKDWIIVESYQFAHNAGTDGKGYVLTSIQHGTTDTSLVDQSGTEASSRLFVGNLTLDSQASAGGEDSWGLWQVNVEPNQYDPGAFANDLCDSPTEPAVAMETLTVAHEGWLI
jgi:hypothetical protein